MDTQTRTLNSFMGSCCECCLSKPQFELKLAGYKQGLACLLEFAIDAEIKVQVCCAVCVSYHVSWQPGDQVSQTPLFLSLRIAHTMIIRTFAFLVTNSRSQTFCPLSQLASLPNECVLVSARKVYVKSRARLSVFAITDSQLNGDLWSLAMNCNSNDSILGLIGWKN